MVKNIGNLKGEAFEAAIGKLLSTNSIVFEKHKRLDGYGKRWAVDFYISSQQTVVECKSISKKNLVRNLQMDFVKFLDLRNKYLQMRFVFVIPEGQPTIDAFVRFCTSYDVKLTTPDRLILDLGKTTKEVNSRIAREKPFNRVFLALESFPDGATKKELSVKVGLGMPFVYQVIKKRPDRIIRSVFTPRRYFTVSAYNNSKEHMLIEELTTSKVPKTDYSLSKKYGFSKFQVSRLRKEKLKMKRDRNWKSKINPDKALTQYFSKQIS